MKARWYDRLVIYWILEIVQQEFRLDISATFSTISTLQVKTMIDCKAHPNQQFFPWLTDTDFSLIAARIIREKHQILPKLSMSSNPYILVNFTVLTMYISFSIFNGFIRPIPQKISNHCSIENNFKLSSLSNSLISGSILSKFFCILSKTCQIWAQ